MRLAAYDELTGLFKSVKLDGEAKQFVTNPNLFKAIVADSNVVAQESGLVALCSLMEYHGAEACTRLRSIVIPTMLEKCLGSTRMGTKAKCTEALMWFIEWDSGEPILDELIILYTHRVPKIIVGALSATKEIVKQFGAKSVNLKDVIKVIPAVCGHADGKVRAECMALVGEIYKWLGDGFADVILPQLKPVQQKELETEFTKLKGTKAKQERLLRSQRAALEKEEANRAADDADMTDTAEDDNGEDALADTIEPVAIQIPPELSEQLSSSKWKDRKEALESFLPIVSVPRLKSTDYSEAIRLMAKCMKDANIQVVSLAANIIEKFATGLRKDFARYVPFVLGSMLERLKERKATVADALRNGLQAIFNTTTLSEILEETLEFLKHKTPQVRIETLGFLVYCFKNTKVMPRPNEIKMTTQAGVKLLSDTGEPVRTGAAELLGVIMKLVGENEMGQYLDGVDEIKRARIKEFFSSATVKAHSKPQESRKRTHKVSAKEGPPSTRRRLDTFHKPSSSSSTASTTVTSSLLSTSSSSASSAPSSILASSNSNGTHHNKASKPHTQSRMTMSSRSLTARPLTSRNAGFDAAERAEFEALKLEKSEWTVERAQFQLQLDEASSERTKLIREISDLQTRNSVLLEDSVRMQSGARNKETELERVREDLEKARERIDKLESVKPISTVQTVGMGPPPSGHGGTLSVTRGKENTVLGMSGLESGGVIKPRQSLVFSMPSGTSSSVRMRGVGSMVPSFKKEPVSLVPEQDDSNWKRAAEVTSQLKARIEMMRRKQEMRK